MALKQVMEHAHILQATSSSSSSSTSSPPATSTTTSPSTPASPTPSTSSMNPVTTNPATNSSPPTSNRASGPTGGSSGRRKRRREEVNEEEEEKVDVGTNGTADEAPSLEDSLMFSDTSVALRIMRAQFPRVDKVSVEPFVLRSQLYSSVEDRTQVDRELETLKRENILRIFKLNTGQDDHAVMLLEDYLKQIERVTKRLEETKKDLFEVFEWFKKYVIDCKLEPSIDHQELCSLLSNGGKVKDGHISLLINAGLLTRQLIDPNMYWFAIPNIGSILKGISQGRKELLSLLNRRRYKEMMLALLEKKRLRMSPLDIRFHLRDLIGSGHLTTVSTPSGLVVQVTRD